ncbi:hypothetical protein CVV65_11645 [Kyrpidia spormannii]|uniref:DUF2512 domain-containing protein n=2 Tax=Alicyclobacillaceae TaxID=186823 RepID=A0A2K8N9M0_9BACL|nr:hypothetical protein CVV65_11645 [Kyrpidia spormannii]
MRMRALMIGFWRVAAAFASLWFIQLFFPLYGSFWLVHLVAGTVVLAGVGYWTDRYVILRWNGFVAAVVDFVLAWATVYLVYAIFPGAVITVTFALLVAWLYAFVELLVHYWVYRREDWEGPDRAEAKQPGP